MKPKILWLLIQKEWIEIVTKITSVLSDMCIYNEWK